MKLLQDKNRNRFFVSHLTVSVTVIGIFLAIVFLLWYPSPLAVAMKVIPIIAMMVMIDVFVGPIFGFLVYKTGKKTLKMDLAIIIMIQIAAFAYGAYSIYQGRPMWIVHHATTFSVVRQVDLVNSQFAVAPSWTAPKFVSYSPKTGDISLKTGDIMKLIKRNVDDDNIYNPGSYSELKKLRGYDFVILEQFNSRTDVEAIKAKYPKATSWIGLATMTGDDLVVLIDENATDNQIVKIVKLKPWN